MKRLLLITIIVTLSHFFTQLTLAENLFDKSEFASRRAKLMELIPDGAAVILGAVPPPESRKFYQSNEFYYFSGVEIPNAVLIIDGVKKESILFFTISEREARSEGISLDLVNNPEKMTGIEKVLPIERLSGYLSSLSKQYGILYTRFICEELRRDNSNEKFNSLQRTMTLKMWDGRLTRELQFVKNLKEKFPQITVADISQTVWDLRKIKSPAEINCMRKAAQIGVKAHTALIKATAVRVKEYELAAVFEYTCKKAGAMDLAYEVILMSGPNHAFGHYHAHDRTLNDGDFIILDAGAEYNYYVSDISSTFPASGKFSVEQQKLYRLANGVRNVCLNNYGPGVSLKQVGEKVRQYIKEQGYNPDDPKYRGTIRYGGYNHSIGMSVHDFLGVRLDPEEPLQPGFVFACDINWPYPDKETGIRLEDVVAITENGSENLSDGLPRTVEEIEAIMNE